MVKELNRVSGRMLLFHNKYFALVAWQRDDDGQNRVPLQHSTVRYSADRSLMTHVRPHCIEKRPSLSQFGCVRYGWRDPPPSSPLSLHVSPARRGIFLVMFWKTRLRRILDTVRCSSATKNGN